MDKDITYTHIQNTQLVQKVFANSGMIVLQVLWHQTCRHHMDYTGFCTYDIILLQREIL